MSAHRRIQYACIDESPKAIVDGCRLDEWHESRDRLPAFRDQPLFPTPDIAQQFAQPRLRVAHAGRPHPCSSHDYIIARVGQIVELPPAPSPRVAVGGLSEKIECSRGGTLVDLSENVLERFVPAPGAAHRWRAAPRRASLANPAFRRGVDAVSPQSKNKLRSYAACSRITPEGSTRLAPACRIVGTISEPDTTIDRRYALVASASSVGLCVIVPLCTIVVPAMISSLMSSASAPSLMM